MSNRVFGDADLIRATRQFVCVRPDTYESKANQEKVRILLGGNLENTAFCILTPDGNQRLSRSGRGMTSDVGGARGLERIALEYRSKTPPEDALVPDFNTFRMALNIAAADSRVLMLVHAPQNQIASTEKKLRAVAWNDEIVGRFHYDFESDAKAFTKPLELQQASPGIYIVHPGTFGVSGKVVNQLPLNSSVSKVIAALKAANEQYAKSTPRKTYAQHVAAGKQQGYYFEMAMPFGEDRDADGEPDKNSSWRYESAKKRSLQTGKYFPVKTK